jgi:hypothetical protein
LFDCVDDPVALPPEYWDYVPEGCSLRHGVTDRVDLQHPIEGDTGDGTPHYKGIADSHTSDCPNDDFALICSGDVAGKTNPAGDDVPFTGYPAKLTIDLSSSNACASGNCPTCFIFHEGKTSELAIGNLWITTDDTEFTLQDCSTARLGAVPADPVTTAASGGQMGSAESAQVLREFKFINLSKNTVIIKDNASPTASRYELVKGSSVTAYCAAMANTATLPNELKNKLAFHRS